MDRYIASALRPITEWRVLEPEGCNPVHLELTAVVQEFPLQLLVLQLLQPDRPHGVQMFGQLLMRRSQFIDNILVVGCHHLQ